MSETNHSITGLTAEQEEIAIKAIKAGAKSGVVMTPEQIERFKAMEEIRAAQAEVARAHAKLRDLCPDSPSARLRRNEDAIYHAIFATGECDHKQCNHDTSEAAKARAGYLARQKARDDAAEHRVLKMLAERSSDDFLITTPLSAHDSPILAIGVRDASGEMSYFGWTLTRYQPRTN